MARLCSEVVFFQLSYGVTNLYRLSKLPSLQVYSHYTTEKEWYRPNGLPGIAHPIVPIEIYGLFLQFVPTELL